MIRIFVHMIFVGFFVNSAFSNEYINFDDVRDMGGFNNIRVSSVVGIIPSGNILSEEEKNDLCQSQYLENLKILDLRGQNITDDFIKIFCENKIFSKIINLNLSDNNITKKSIEFILESNYIGSIRDFHQTSARHGVASSQVQIRVENIKLDRTFIGDVNTAKIYKKQFYIKSNFGDVTGIKVLTLQY